MCDGRAFEDCEGALPISSCGVTAAGTAAPFNVCEKPAETRDRRVLETRLMQLYGMVMGPGIAINKK
ncbi:hypothetical protein PG990_001544 [Apiospora arundinis]